MNSIGNVLDRVKRIHFIGIGGAGMCPLAEILHSKGYLLSGSDNNETDTLKRIRNLGIPVMMGQRAQNIEGAEMIVYSAAIMKDNEELCAAKASTIPTFERAELLGELTRRYDNCIAVAGTHGKTTVTSMITQMMFGAGVDPTAVIGGKLNLIGGNGRVGQTQNMVCEACEFVDTFLRMHPDISVILNIDEDHLDYFGSLENIIRSFHRFADLATKAEMYDHARLFSIVTLKPGCSIGYHIHEQETEYYYILSGEAVVSDNGTEVTMLPGDLMSTGNGDGHSIENRSDKDMAFLALIVLA